MRAPPQGYSNAILRSDADSEQALPRLHQASQTPLPRSCWQPRASLQSPSLSGDLQHHATSEAAAATRQPSSALPRADPARVSYPPFYTLHNNPERVSLLPEKFSGLGRQSDKKPAAVTNLILKNTHPGHIPIPKPLQLQEHPALALNQLHGAQLVMDPQQ